MVLFSKIFGKKAVRAVAPVTSKRAGEFAEAAGKTGSNLRSDAERPASVYAELEKAANAYAAQLEKATRELGYNLKDYEGITN